MRYDAEDCEETRSFVNEIGGNQMLCFLYRLCNELCLKNMDPWLQEKFRRNALRLILKKIWKAVCDYSNYSIAYQKEQDQANDSGDALSIGNQIELRKNGNLSWIDFMMNYQIKGICPDLGEIPPEMQEYAYRQSVDFIRQRL